MNKQEQALLHASIVILLVAAGCYLSNLDLYTAVRNMHPVYGFRDFIEASKTTEFLSEVCDGWLESNSFVLQEICACATGLTDKISILVPAIQAVIIIGYYYLWAFVPFLLFLIIRVRQRKKGVCVA